MKYWQLVILAAWVSTGIAAVHACDVEFTLDRTGSPANQVLISGTFNGWAATVPAGAWEMTDSDHNNIWELNTDLAIDTYLYKFIVDGAWIQDPANPESDPDGFGGYNSILNVDCDEPHFNINSVYMNESAGAFTSSLTFIPGEDGGNLDSATVSVTLNYQSLPASAWLVSGNSLQVNVSGILDGINDIRVNGSSTGGIAAETILLKAYKGYSKDWRDAVMYFAMTDRFYNGDSANDDPISGLPELTNYVGGDLQGILDKIEDGYFSDLGVNAIWISWPGDNPDTAEWGSYVDSDDCQIPQGAPGYPRVDKQYSGYHGYWPRYLDQVEEHFGTMDTLKNLVIAAHQQGIRILIDLPINHVHESSPFVTNHPTNYFNMDPIEICEEIAWARPQTCWFSEFLPDIHYENERAVRDFMRMASWWVEQSGCDGFRVDALKHVAWNFINSLRYEMNQKFGRSDVEFYLVGETFSGDPNDIANYIGEDLVHGQFDFPLNLHMLKAFGTQETGLDSLYSSTRSFQETYRNKYASAVMSNFIGNHDIARFLSLAAGDLYCGVWDNISHISQGWRHPPGLPNDEAPYAKLRIAFTYLMTIPGIPLIYYGDEVGLPGANDPDNRRPMVFDGDLNGFQQENLEYLQMLTQIRNDHDGLRYGTLGPALWADSSFLAFPRLGTSERIAVVINRSGSSRTETINVSSLGVSNGQQMTDAISGNSVTVQNNSISVTLNAWSAAIYINETSGPSPTPTPTQPGPSPTPTPTPTPPGNPTFTPTPPVSPTPTNTPADTNRSVSIYTNQNMFTADDLFRLTVRVHNGPYPVTAALYVLLDAGGVYLFWPSWTEQLDFRSISIDAESDWLKNILDFQWPGGAGSGGAQFYAAIFQPMTWNLLADVDYCQFQWQ